MAGVLAGVRRIVLPELPRQPMDQPELMRPRTKAESSPSRGGPPGKTPSVPQSPAAIPIVPDYDLLRRIGGGAYGEVWLARSKATGALRAAKIVLRTRFEDERPFRREFEGIQRFEEISRGHNSQLALFHIGRNDPEGYFYYVMELADDLNEERGMQNAECGYTPHTLRADLAKGRLATSRILEIGLALTEALGHLHQNGLVHRDVKPSNVIFVNGRPKLADIGLVTDASDQCSIVGTEGYLPPEGPGTPQADIFALGKVLYEAATGMDRHEFPKLPEDLRSWPDSKWTLEINEVVLRACARKQDERFSNCQEIHDELVLLQRGYSVKRKRRAHRYLAVGWKAALALGVATALSALVFYRPYQSGRSQPSTDGPDSTNLEANALCDRAMYILRGDDYAEVGAAYTNFHKAIALDPNFARPYVGLLELGVREDVDVPGLSRPTTDDLRLIARYLEQLAPHLAATHVAQSVIDLSDGRFEESERRIQEAIQANPNYEFAHTFYSWLLGCYGRPEEALRQLEIARRLAPSKVIIYRAFGNTYYALRDYTNAILWYRQAIGWEPHHSVAWHGVGASLRAMGDYTNALDYLEKDEVLEGADETSTKERYALLRRAIKEQGTRGYWIQQLKWAENNTNETCYWKAVIQIHLGNTNAALDLLEQSHKNREQEGGFETLMNLLLYDDHWDGLHENPRFKKLLDEMGYTKVTKLRKR